MSDTRSASLADSQTLLCAGFDGVRFVDASWHLDRDRDARAEYDAEHLPNAVFFDIDAVSDRASALPHMLPSPDVFAEAAGALGLTEGDDVVVYDTVGLFSAPRAWWTFRTMGAKRVRVLDGGLPAWRAAGGPLEAGDPASRASRFAATMAPDAVVGRDELEAALGRVVLLDARPSARFRGEAPEPRPGLRSGHAPGAVSLPVSEVVRDGRLLPEAELRTVVSNLGAKGGAPVVTTCGSGVTAAILTLALATLGVPSRLYDGSWAEWGAPGGGPVETGAQRPGPASR